MTHNELEQFILDVHEMTPEAVVRSYVTQTPNGDLYITTVEREKPISYTVYEVLEELYRCPHTWLVGAIAWWNDRSPDGTMVSGRIRVPGDFTEDKKQTQTRILETAEREYLKLIFGAQEISTIRLASPTGGVQ